MITIRNAYVSIVSCERAFVKVPNGHAENRWSQGRMCNLHKSLDSSLLVSVCDLRRSSHRMP